MEVATELEEQITVVGYLEKKRHKFTAIPNATYTTSWGQKIKNKKSGLRKGLPDLLIIVNNNLCFIEMKRKIKSVLGHEQEEWIKALNKCNGVEAVVCYGADDAIDFIQFKEKNNARTN